MENSQPLHTFCFLIPPSPARSRSLFTSPFSHSSRATQFPTLNGFPDRALLSISHLILTRSVVLVAAGRKQAIARKLFLRQSLPYHMNRSRRILFVQPAFAQPPQDLLEREVVLRSSHYFVSLFLTSAEESH